MTIYKRVIKYPDYRLEQFYQSLDSALNCVKDVEQTGKHLWIGTDSVSGHLALVTTEILHA